MADASSPMHDMERAAQDARKSNPDQLLNMPVDEIYQMRDAATGRSDGSEKKTKIAAQPALPPSIQIEKTQQAVKQVHRPAPLQEDPPLRRSSKGLFEQDHATGSDQGAQSAVKHQHTPTHTETKIKTSTMQPQASPKGDSSATTGREHTRQIKPQVTQMKSESPQPNEVVILREDTKNETTNETLEKQKEEERKRQEEERKRQEEEKKEDEARVRLGIQIASQTEQEGTILRCIDGGPKIEAKDIIAPNVSVGIYMLNLEADTGLTTGLFFADFLLFLRREDKPLKTKDPMSSLAFTNARSINEVKDYGSGVQRVSGTFFFSPDLRWFPFDQQTLEIVLEQFKLPIAEYVFVPDYHLNGLSPSVRFPGWATSLRYGDSEHANCKASAGYKLYPGASLDTLESAANVSFSRFSYKLSVQRPIVQGFMTHFIPIMIMVTPTVFSYTLDPLQHIAMRFSIAGGALLSIILFHTSVESSLPPIEYMCLFDKFVFCIYFAVFCALVTTVAVAILFRNEGAADVQNGALRERLHNISLRMMVISTVVIFGMMFPIWIVVGSTGSWVVLILCLIYLVFLFLQWYKVRREQDVFLDAGFVSLGESKP